MQPIHIIAFNVPEPPTYGGVIDIFYQVKAFYEMGFQITLHCFYQDSRKAEQLHNWCEAIHYYPRKPAIQSISRQYPMMMKSRRSKALIDNLIQDDNPIFFEGMQTCYCLNHSLLRNRLKLVKLHNIEWKYYQALGEATNNPLYKLFYYIESKKLYHSEHIFRNVDYLLAVSQPETEYYQARFNGVKRLPCFHGNRNVTAEPGMGDYLLYHGNLSIAENEKAAEFLLNHIMPAITTQKLVIAGRNPSQRLIKSVNEKSNVELISNPDDAQMKALIKNAHLHLLPSFQNTGFKLKLINTLYQGRHCLVTPEMAEGSGLEELCIIVKNNQDFIDQINELMITPFSQAHIEQRRQYLTTYFSDLGNAEYVRRLMNGEVSSSSNMAFEESQKPDSTNS